MVDVMVKSKKDMIPATGPSIPGNDVACSFLTRETPEITYEIPQ